MLEFKTNREFNNYTINRINNLFIIYIYDKLNHTIYHILENNFEQYKTKGLIVSTININNQTDLMEHLDINIYPSIKIYKGNQFLEEFTGIDETIIPIINDYLDLSYSK